MNSRLSVGETSIAQGEPQARCERAWGLAEGLVARAVRLWPAVVLAGCSLVIGCSGSQPGRMGRAYLEAGDYDRAVQAAKQAVDKEPSNADYLDLLSDAQTAAADSHFEKAEKLRTGHRPSEALKELDKTLEYMPAHPGANTARVEVEKQIRHCREFADKAREALLREEWEQAALLAQEASATDQGDPTASQLFEHARLAMAANYLAQATAALNAGDAKACLDACGRAKKWDPDNAYLATLERKAANLPQRARVAASPAPKQVPDTQPALQPTEVALTHPVKEERKEKEGKEEVVAVAKPQAAEAASAEPKPAEQVTAAPQAAEEPSVKPQPARKMRTEDAPRTPPRLARAERATGRGTVAEPRPAERLIESQPLSLEQARAGQQKTAARESAREPALITAESHGPGQPHPAAGRLPGAALSTRPAENGAGESRPIAGVIEDARLRAGAGSLNSSATGGLSTSEDTGGQAVRGTTSEPKRLFRGAMSRGDKRYKKEMAVMDGILIKLKDTDREPLDADFEIVAGKFRIKPDDVPPGGKINLRGVSGRTYVMTVIWIDHDQDTVHFAVDRVE